MHELSIATAMIEQCEDLAESDWKSIARIVVKIGSRSGVDPAALQTAFPLAAEDTLCAKAQLEIIPDPCKAECDECGWKGILDTPIGLCPECAAIPARISGGENLVIQAIEGNINQ